MGGTYQDEENEEETYTAGEREPTDEDLWQEAIEAVSQDYLDTVFGYSYKYYNYLHNLLHHIGIQAPSELPDPSLAHGGLPSYDDMVLKNVTNQQTESIPGALSSWRVMK